MELSEDTPLETPTTGTLRSVGPKKSIMITVKLAPAELDRIKKNADRWAEGNLSEWIRYAAMELDPKPEHLIY